MKIGFKQQLWISFGIIFGGAVATGVALYFLSGDITAQADKIISDKALIARQTAVVSILANLKNDAPRAVEYSAAIRKLLPTHDELIGFSPWLNSLGKAHNVSVSFSFQGNNTVVTESSPGIDGFSLGADGAFADLVSFLKDIETEAPGFLLTIDSFDITTSDAGYHLTAQGKLFSQ